MTTEEWIEKNLAAAPPPTPAQIATLRAIFAPVIPHMKAASAATEAAHRMPAPQAPMEGASNAPR